MRNTRKKIRRKKVFSGFITGVFRVDVATAKQSLHSMKFDSYSIDVDPVELQCILTMKLREVLNTSFVKLNSLAKDAERAMRSL